jgi:hypothetical protein
LAPVRVCPQNPGAATAAAAENIMRNLLTLAGALRLLEIIAALS